MNLKHSDYYSNTARLVIRAPYEDDCLLFASTHTAIQSMLCILFIELNQMGILLQVLVCPPRAQIVVLLIFDNIVKEFIVAILIILITISIMIFQVGRYVEKMFLS